jgi:hypothetical protein
MSSLLPESRLLRTLVRRGFQRGVLGGERYWALAGSVAMVVHLGRRALRHQPDVVFSHRLGPGEVLQLREVAGGSRLDPSPGSKKCPPDPQA